LEHGSNTQAHDSTPASATKALAGDPGWPRVAVLGAGAVGSFFGGLLARAGAPVTLIARPQHVEAINRNGLFIDGMNLREPIPIAASTQVADAASAALILFCVKTVDTETAARALAPHLAPGALVMSCQNGVDNCERIGAATGIEAIAAAVYVAVSLSGPGRVLHSGRSEFVIGNLPRQQRSQDELERLAGVFRRAGIGCAVSANLEGELWMKLILNCAYNAISALGRSPYAAMTANPQVRETMRQVAKEVIAVASAAGVRLPPGDAVDATIRLADSMPGQISSTAHDLARGRPTEIDSLNGYIVRRGQQLGVPVPVNQALYALVKLREANATAGA
jgi:2-dehydropantoate 2-reductase